MNYYRLFSAPLLTFYLQDTSCSGIMWTMQTRCSHQYVFRSQRVLRFLPWFFFVYRVSECSTCGRRERKLFIV